MAVSRWFQKSSGLLPGHGRNGRRKWAEFVAVWFVCFAVTGGGAAWEAVRLADARGTVASGWASGIAAGVGLGLALEALVAVPVLVQLRRPRSVGRPKVMFFLVLILTIVLLVFVAFATSAPPKQPGPVPYVTTSGIGVAEIAYVCTFLSQFAMGVLAWLVVALRRHRPLVD
jgi:hypothetical protein